jgi:hypothetical protein
MWAAVRAAGFLVIRHMSASQTREKRGLEGMIGGSADVAARLPVPRSGLMAKSKGSDAEGEALPLQ